jgi:hypothetical protein
MLDYSRSYETVVDGLGPLQAHIISPHLTVGGHLHMRVLLPSPAPKSTIRQVRLDIVQTIELQSRKDAAKREDCTPERVTIAKLRQDDVIDNKAQGGWIVKQVVRVASEDHVRPSTLQPSQARIRIRHMLELTIRFQPDGSKAVMTYCAKWPVVLSSVRTQCG